MKKRILAIFMLIVVFITNIDLQVAKAIETSFIDEEGGNIQSFDGFIYHEEEDYIVIDEYRGESEVLKIPEKINGKVVKKIGDFFGGEPAVELTLCNVKEITIPNTVEEIGINAFIYTKKLKKLEIPSNVKKIGKGAFERSGLKSISIPNGVKIIEEGTFSGCYNLEKVNFGGNIEKIEEEAFFDCKNLENINLGKEINYIGREAFINCESLKSINLGEKIKYIGARAFFNCPLEKVYLPKSLEEIEEEVFSIDTKNIEIAKDSPIKDKLSLYDYVYPEEKYTKDGFKYYERENKILISGYEGKDRDIEIPEEINGKPVTEIIKIENRRIISIKTPKTLEKIRDCAFSVPSDSCSIEKVTLNEGLKEIGMSAFESTDIRNIVIPKTVEKIGERAFWNCNLLKNVTLQEGIKEIGEGAFKNTSIKSISLPKSLEKIGQDVFPNIPKEKIKIDEGSPILDRLLSYDFISKEENNEYNGFYDDFKYTINTYYKSGTDIRYEAIAIERYIGDSDIVEIPKEINGMKVREISSYAFRRSPVKKVILPNTLEEIAREAFYESTIEEITIPKSVKKISSFAFVNCTNLKKLTLEEGIEKICNGAFLNTAIQSIVIPKTVSYMGKYVFSNIPKEKIKISEASSIKDDLLTYSFVDYKDLLKTPQYNENGYIDTTYDWHWYDDYNYEDEDLILYYDDFKYCENEDYVTIMKYDGNGKVIEIPDTINGKKVKKIANYDYNKCSDNQKKDIKEIKIGRYVEEIGKDAFMGMNIENLTIPGNVKKIGEGAFSYCKDLKKLILEEGIEEIGSRAFFDTQLESVYIPKTVKYIGNNAFSGISKYKIYIDDECENKDAFENYDFLFDDVIIKSLKANKPIGVLGESIVLEADVKLKDTSKLDDIKYKFEVVDDKGNKTILQNFKEQNKCTWIPKKTGKFTITVSVIEDYDEGENVVSKSIKYLVTDKLEDVKINDLEAELIDEGTINVKADGEGEGEVQYKFSIKDKEGLHTIKDYSKENTCMILTPSLTKGEEIYVEVMDESNRTKTKSLDASSIKKSKNYNEEEFNLNFNLFNLKDVFVSNDFEYNENDDRTINILKYIGKNINITIPEKINGKNVTTIGNRAFDDCYENTKIKIPKTIKNIAKNAFNDCISLKNIEVDKDNKYYSSEEGILFDKNKTKLIRYPQGKDSVSVYKIPKKVETLDEFSFYNCSNISRIVVPKSIKNIEYSAIYTCQYSNIEVNKKNKNYKDIDGVLFDKTGKVLIKYPIKRKESTYEIPYTVKKIASYAFFDTNIKNIIMLDEIKELGNMTFYKCNVEEIKLSNNIETMGDGEFRECTNLKEIRIPRGIKSIESYAFNGCTNLNSVNLPEGLIEIKNNAFNKCTSLVNINFPKTLYKINNYAFSECTSLEYVTIYNGLKILGDYSFNKCTNLKNINIPYEFLKIGTNAFYGVKNSKINGIRYDYQNIYTTKNNMSKMVFNN